MSVSTRLVPALLLLSIAQGCKKDAYAPTTPSSGDYRRGAYPGGNASPPMEVTAAAAPARAESYATADSDSDGSNDEKATADMPTPPPAPRAPMAEAPQPAPAGGEKKSDAKPEPARPDGRDASSAISKQSPILIYTATFNMAVFEVQNSLMEVERLARDSGGFITKRTDKLITIRVPAPRFYEAVGRIEKLGDMLQRDVVAQDVTEEFLDTEIRLRNARAVRDRLAQLLAKANSVQDSLMIERELNRVAAEIDRMEGRLKYLRDRAAFSTITVSFEARRTVAPPPSVRLPFPWLHSSGLSRLLSL